ncbi:MAG: sel1 repeat family protein [Elusimicrobiota bacterium]|jgi:TPR repeat protein|nr:sel1 repeat family protein [Elusimicrobiota bacterium]
MKNIFELYAQAQEGDPKSQNDLAMAFTQGVELPKDKEEAYIWFKEAADQEYGAAMVNLAKMYEIGDFVVQDYEEAARLYEKAAKQGNAEAMNKLSALYSDGLGVEKNKKTALEWLKKAAKQKKPAENKELLKTIKAKLN